MSCFPLRRLERVEVERTFEGVWDERLPRDKNGCIILDESPACVKHLVGTAKRNPGDTRAIEPLPADEDPYLEYISDVLGVLSREEISVGGPSGNNAPVDSGQETRRKVLSPQESLHKRRSRCFC